MRIGVARKEPSLLKAVSAKHTCSPVAGNGDSRQIAEKLLVRLKTNKQTDKHTGYDNNYKINLAISF
jgi:hypothetical protein